MLADSFIRVFKREWETVREEWSGRHDETKTPSDLLALYDRASAWTQFMLRRVGPGMPTPFLRRVVETWGGLPSLSLRDDEWDGFDLVATTPLDMATPWAGERDVYWRSAMSVLIEHENGDDVHTEMRKLIHRRAALKVLIFYDFRAGARERIYRGDPTVEPGPAGEWLDKKHRLLADMVSAAERSPLGPDGAEYLIVVGSWRGETVDWRYSIKVPGETFTPMM